MFVPLSFSSSPNERRANLLHSYSSNGGVFGSLYGTPIINTPQAAVLGAFPSFPLLLGAES